MSKDIPEYMVQSRMPTTQNKIEFNQFEDKVYVDITETSNQESTNNLAQAGMQI